MPPKSRTKSKNSNSKNSNSNSNSNKTKSSRASKSSGVSYFSGKVIPEKLLGAGESGKVYSIKGDTDNVLKTAPFKNKTQRSQLISEITIQQRINEKIPHGAPKIINSEIIGSTKGEVIIIMEKINTFDKGILDLLEPTFQIQLVDLIAEFVINGFVHNDIHTDNIAMNSRGEPILIDFGLTVEIPTPLDVITFNQILIAQLYAIVDPCNINNCPKYSEKQKHPNCGFTSKHIGNLCQGHILDVIYHLRNNKSYMYDKLTSGK
jgi:hypothetical protein